MTTAGVLTFLFLFLGFVFLVVALFGLTLLGMAFIGQPEDMNDVEIKGEPKQK